MLPATTSAIKVAPEPAASRQKAAMNGRIAMLVKPQRKGLPIETRYAPKTGTVDWLFREYKQSLAYTKEVAVRSRRDYEWAMSVLCDFLTKSGNRVGSLPIRTVTSRGADKLYQRILVGPRGRRDRTAEKVVKLCRKAWRLVHRLFPQEFDKAIPNPWLGVTLETRVKKTKQAVTREQVYEFANACVAAGELEVAAVAVICFEWLQRPENVIAGSIKWSDYRAASAPTIIRVEHHKTGTVAPHPLEETLPDGSVVKFYEDAEEVLSALPRRGVPMILRQAEGVSKPFAFSTMQHKVQRLRKKLGLPPYFTLDACRHGGMTELEEAELTDKDVRSRRTRRSNHTRAMRSAQPSECSLLRESAMRIGLRTKRGYSFGMRCRTTFGMGITRTNRDAHNALNVNSNKLAGDAVLIAPVSATNSLLTGKLTGNFITLNLFTLFSLPIPTTFQ